MAIYEAISRIGPDGILHLQVPLGHLAANCDVRVTIEPVAPPLMEAADAWRKRVLAIAGSIDDPTFRRHEQGELDEPPMRP